jgi:hypothetical protein
MKNFIISFLILGILALPVQARRRWIPPTTSATNDLKTGLSSYYAFDESSGDALDSSGNGYNLTLTGTATRSAGGPLSFYRTLAGIGSANYFTSTNVVFKPGSNVFSFCAWINPTTMAQASYPGIVSLYTASNHAYLLYLDDPSDKMAWAVSANGTSDTTVTSSTAMTAGNWYFFVVVCDGTNVKISFNGGTFTTAAFSSAIYNATATFYAGAIDGASSTWSGGLTGIGYWNGRALSQGNVTTLYNGGAGLPFSSWGP